MFRPCRALWRAAVVGSRTAPLTISPPSLLLSGLFWDSESPVGGLEDKEVLLSLPWIGRSDREWVDARPLISEGRCCEFLGWGGRFGPLRRAGLCLPESGVSAFPVAELPPLVTEFTMPLEGKNGWPHSFSLLLSSLSFRFLSSNPFKTAFSFQPSPSRTAFHSSTSPNFPNGIKPPFLPCSLSTHLLASSCAPNFRKRIPRALPFSLSIWGSKDTRFPYCWKFRRRFWLGVRGEMPVMRTERGGGGPAEFSSY